MAALAGRPGRPGTALGAGVVALAVALTSAGCESSADGWEPVLETAPPSYLEREISRAVEEVATAREELESGPRPAAEESTPEAGSLLESAQQRLEALEDVYLPLYRAGVAASNAYRYNALGQTREAERALDEVDGVVSGLSRATGGSLEGELEQVSALVARSRVALSADAPDAAENLRKLAETLVDLVTRAGLII